MHSILFSVIVDTAISATLSSSSSSNRRNASQINKSHDFVIARINEIQQNQITPRAFLAWKLSVLKCLNSSSFSVLHSSQNYSIEVFQLHWIYKKKKKKKQRHEKKREDKKLLHYANDNLCHSLGLCAHFKWRCLIWSLPP